MRENDIFGLNFEFIKIQNDQNFASASMSIYSKYSTIQTRKFNLQNIWNIFCKTVAILFRPQGEYIYSNCHTRKN